MRVTRVVPALFDPRLRTATEILWPSVCTIQLRVYNTESGNQRVFLVATDIDGMVEIPARSGPTVRERPTDDLNRFSGQVVSEYHLRRHVDLNGYYPQILPETMQAVIDGVVYPIRGVEHDGQHWITRIKVEITTPHG